VKSIGAGPRPFAKIAQELLNKPLAIEPYKAEVILCAIQQRLGIVSLDTIDGMTLEAKQMLDRAASAQDATRNYDKGRTFHADGNIAVIHIDGTLVHKFGWLDPMSGMTGYDGIATKLRDAMRDPDIEGIWLDIDSPGGAVSGLFALCEELAASTLSEGGKPIYAYVNEQACSAAYMIASVCDRVYGPQDAMVGSIGCVMLHHDYTAMMDDAGIKVTVIRAGERKMRGNSYEGLDDTTLAKYQASVDDVRVRFSMFVAAGRGIEFDAVMATEADWFEGAEAVRLGLMDAVLPEREAWSRLEEEIDTIKRERRSAQ
jgi:capsid assembly protease